MIRCIRFIYNLVLLKFKTFGWFRGYEVYGFFRIDNGDSRPALLTGSFKMLVKYFNYFAIFFCIEIARDNDWPFIFLSNIRDCFDL